MVSFVDRVTLFVRAGHGGNGCVSVRREKFKPLAGPDGGNGGHGGDIVLVADPQVTTLLAYHGRPHRSSDNGQPGMGDNRSGAAGETLELPVPVGTVVKDEDGVELADLDQPGMRFVVAPGGLGGLGNAALASTKRKAPGFALLGTPGYEGEVALELKTIADVALVGFPSAGKSSLIAALSAARPKIADYPFTTLHPNLGVVRVDENRSFVIADVPGLIEGAAEGAGLGHQFLRHLQRTRLLLHLVDLAPFDPDADPVRDARAIVHELEKYDPALHAKPRWLVLNKIDLIPAEECEARVKAFVRSYRWKGPVFAIAAINGAGCRELTFAIQAWLEAHPPVAEPAPESAAPVVVTPPPVAPRRRRVAKDAGA